MNSGDVGEKKGPGFDCASVFEAGDYLYFYERSLKEEYTRQEVDFLVRELALLPDHATLDLACGHGRHANELASRGFSVTGIDRSSEFIAIARADAKKRGLRVTYSCDDSRTFVAPEQFDRVLHLFSSFGYFPDDENEQVIRNIAASLKPGGLFCFDILNRDAFLKFIPPFGVTEKDGNLMIDRNRFDPLTGRLYNARIIIRDGVRRDLPFFLRLYNPTEIVRLLETAGLRLEKICADWDGNPFAAESRRMIIIAQKSE